MLDEKGFDLWADGYDKSVQLSDEDNRYPFAGYKELLNQIFRRVLEKDSARVLDMGFGTGVLTTRLYQQGCSIWGQDFSENMCRAAQAKMPAAHLYQGDFSQGIAAPLRQQKYDFIIATYSLHHLDYGQKTALIRELLALLERGGKLLMGDVAFADQAALERCRLESGDLWDEDEFYFVYEQIRQDFPAIRFEQLSSCAGLFELEH